MCPLKLAAVNMLVAAWPTLRRLHKLKLLKYGGQKGVRRYF